MDKRIHLLAMSLLLSVLSYGQSINLNDYHSNIKNIKSPTAASLGAYGDVPVDMFTGTVNISVPLTTVHSGPIEVPVALSYNSSGIKVNAPTGWAGMGWNLVAGGQITRKVNGYADEYKSASPNAPAFGPFYDKGYYFNGKFLNNSNWNTTTFIESELNYYTAGILNGWHGFAVDLEPDEFDFSFGNYSGSFFRSENGQWKVRSQQNLHLKIEEKVDTSAFYKIYAFDQDKITRYNSYSYIASLFTEFTITTPDGYQYIFGRDTNAIEFSRGPINKNGPMYAYQNPLEDVKNYITANTWYLTKIVAPSGDNVVFHYKRGRVIFEKNKVFTPGFFDPPSYTGSPQHKWTGAAINPSYLDYIETPSTKIEFTTKTSQELGMSTDPTYNSETQNLMNGLTLNYPDLVWSNLQISGHLRLPHYNQQLDSVKIFDKLTNKYVYGYKLFQTEDTTRRRTLDSVSTFGIADNSSSGKYKFYYDHSEKLPRIESLCRDHWGLFNSGQEESMFSNTFTERASSANCLYGLLNKIIYPTGGETDLDFEQAAYSHQMVFNPDNTSAPVQYASANGNAGIRIKTITNIPNAGATPVTRSFFYTMNYASGGSGSSGTLGINFPTYTAGGGYIDQLTYQINWGSGGTMSSDPNCNGTFTENNNVDDNSEFVDMLHGKVVTYSEVTEKLSSGGFTVYKFRSNDDPAYRDEMADNFASTNAEWIQDIADDGVLKVVHNYNFRLTTNDLERGKIVSKEDYNSSGAKVHDVLYSYVDDPDRKNSYIKALAHKELYTVKDCGNFPIGSLSRGWAYRIYCYNNPVKTITEHTYNNDATVSQTQSFTYDVNGNVVEKATETSDHKILTESTRFNSNADYLNGSVTTDAAKALRKLYTQYNILNYPVETTITIEPDPAFGATTPDQKMVTGSTLYEYYLNKPTISVVYKLELAEPFPSYVLSGGQYVPNFISSTIVNGDVLHDARYKVQNTITPYTHNNDGKPATIVTANTPVAYTWDYAGEEMTSVTQNAANNEVAYTGFEGKMIYLPYNSADDNKGNWNFSPDDVTINTAFAGHNSLQLVSNGPLGVSLGVTSTNNIPSGTHVELAFWAKGLAPIVKQGSVTLPMYSAVKTVGSWSLFVYPITGNNSKVSIVSQPTTPPVTQTTAYIDEVKLYPQNASMKTYTYDGGTENISAIGDGNNSYIFYEYDGLGRLLQSKDENGQVLKKYSYHYRPQ